ncbi:hypothetical protein EAX62_02620 [Tessaracoccus antarcticus]|uniref:Uncharacterized protein n=1 Tax=Tessaracoccus antarcticus TaxID=2479848 RepID=A0A3M0G980_9ACTN|nr:hypothetical protein EAX62_02620 [Tessaracoccus antarcticus]
MFEGDRLIGSQDVSARNFATLHVVDSGSYLRLDAHWFGIRNFHCAGPREVEPAHISLDRYSHKGS